MTEPLSCPFCGHVGGQILESAPYGYRTVMCECGATGPKVDYLAPDDKAIAEWNRRAVVVPDGFALVPIKPSERMFSAGLFGIGRDDISGELSQRARVAGTWAGMLAAYRNEEMQGKEGG